MKLRNFEDILSRHMKNFASEKQEIVVPFSDTSSYFKLANSSFSFSHGLLLLLLLLLLFCLDLAFMPLVILICLCYIFTLSSFLWHLDQKNKNNGLLIYKFLVWIWVQKNKYFCITIITRHFDEVFLLRWPMLTVKFIISNKWI
jgi:hypothetical protein